MADSLIMKRKRDRCTPESELRYRQNKRILNEGFNSLSLNRYTSITDVDYGNFADEEYSPPPTNSPRNRTNRTRFRSDSRQSDVTDDEAKPPEEEYMLSVIKGGQKKYLRKVDFLVDELIRKSSRTDLAKTYCPKEFDSQLPPSVGPSPTADHALTNPFWLVNYLENGGKVEYLRSQLLDLQNKNKNDSSSWALVEKKPNTHSGDTTHADWGIIELPTSSHSSGPFKSPEAHEKLKQGYYTGDTNSSCESIDAMGNVTNINSHGNRMVNGVSNSGNQKGIAAQNNNNGFKNIRSNAYGNVDSSGESDCEMQQDSIEGQLFYEDLDDEQASMEPHPRDSVNNNRSRVNSFESNYSDISALSDISKTQNNPYYVDPDDNVYFMLDGNITETNHKRRATSRYAKGHVQLNEKENSNVVSNDYDEDEDDVMCDESAGGYKYYNNSNKGKNLEKDLVTVLTNDAIFCID